jgi:hypothetical protein
VLKLEVESVAKGTTVILMVSGKPGTPNDSRYRVPKQYR